jgi:translin
MNHWSEIAEQLRQQVEARHQAREAGLQACRKATQLCARAIRSLHRHEFDACRDLLTQAYREISHAREQLRPFPQIYYAGFLQDAEKELVEGETLYAIVLGDALPEPDELGVDVGAYLNGVAEAASECRRYVLDLLRAGELAHAETLLGVMDEIYDELVTFDYPDAVTGGLTAHLRRAARRAGAHPRRPDPDRRPEGAGKHPRQRLPSPAGTANMMYTSP